MWVAHFTVKQAKDLFFLRTGTRKLENVKVIGDQTEFMLKQPGGESLKEQLENNAIGFGGVMYTGQSVGPAQKGTWVFRK